MKNNIPNNKIENNQEYQNKLSAALKTAGVCIFEVDIIQQRYTFFQNSEAIFGVSGEEILNDLKAFSNLSKDEYMQQVSNYFVHPKDTKTVEKAFKKILSGNPDSYTARMKAKDSEYIWCKVDVTPVTESNGNIKMVGIISNINDFKSKLDSLSYEIQLDNFTKLYNKNSFKKSCKNILKNKPDNLYALLIIDIDDFKKFNDNHGHPKGDEIILSIAKHLKSFFAKQDIIARYGGDEFVVFMTNVSSKNEVIEKVNNYIKEKDNEYDVTKSIGLAFYDNDSISFEKLLKTADKALYKAKETKNSLKIKKS